MAVSRTWQGRLRRWQGYGHRLGRLALVGAAMFGAAAGCKVFLAPDHPNIEAMSQRIDNRQAQVGAFAADFVVSWLTATTEQRRNLQRFITFPDNALTLPTTPAAVVTVPQVVSVINTGTIGDADIYATTVSVNERPYASARPTRAFYRVPVAIWNFQPRAVALPARINGPGPGADFKTAYPQALSADSALFGLANGFIRTYLTDGSGLDRYVMSGTALAPVRGYQSAAVTTAAADRSVPVAPAPGEQVHVLANVTAQTSQFATVNLVYPLTLENSDGTWMVAAIDLTPQISGTADPAPVGTE